MPMRRASSRWRSAGTIRNSIGFRLNSAASFRSTRFTFRKGWREPCAATGFASRPTIAFAEVLHGCAEGVTGRPNTWINAEIIRLYTSLYAAGRAHSIECWREEKLVGGLYGVSLGGAFFGESMFSRERDASKVALVHLVARLKVGGYALLDTQFLTKHLTQFGAIEITRLSYLARLREALAHPAYWPASSGNAAGFSLSVASGETGFTGFKGPTATVWPGSLALQVITHTS